MEQFQMHNAGAACNLDEKGAAQRNAEFGDVVGRGLRHRRRTPDGRVRLEFDKKPGMESDIRALVARESECCGFFSFEVAVGEDDILVEVTAPAGKSEYLDELYDATDPHRAAVTRVDHSEPR